MKITFITTGDASDIHNWSGSVFYIAKALEKQLVEIEYIDKLASKPNLTLKLKKILWKILNRSFDYEREPYIQKQYVSQIEKRISSDTDIIFSIGTIPIALLNTSIPIIFYTDATFAGMIGFYNSFKNLSSETLNHGNILEQKALDSVTIAIYASEWAANSALDSYRTNPNKIKVVPFGANIDHKYNLNDIKNFVINRSNTICKLLFIGVEWNRKGADLALQVTKNLNDAGRITELHLVGLKRIPKEPLPGYVINHGFISKSTQQGKEKLNKLFIESHFLIVPSIAEAYGLVFCEANSYGVPSLSRNVGGISTIIKDDLNGKLFNLSAPADEYSKYIETNLKDYTKYERLATSSYIEYKNRLNWDVSGAKILNLFEEITSKE